MFKSLFAIIAAATCAAVLVGFVPPPVPAVAAAQSTARGVSDVSTPAARALATDVRNAGCAQAWPYYEPSCLRDNRWQNGRAPIVRVIAIGKPAADRTVQAQR